MIAEGVVPGVWFTDSWNIGETPQDAYFTVGEVEGEGDRQGILNAPAFSVPKAVLISGTAFTDSSGVPIPAQAQPLIQAGWKCLVECYRNETTDYPPDMVKLATEQLGWPRAQPVFGVHNAPLSHFKPWMQGGWGVYLGEYLL